jgi:restriction endonuclease Mrr
LPPARRVSTASCCANPEFVAFQKRSAPRSISPEPTLDETAPTADAVLPEPGATPEESLEQAFEELNQALAAELLAQFKHARRASSRSWSSIFWWPWATAARSPMLLKS